MLDRIRDGLCPAGDLQLGEDIAHMRFYRCETDDQGLCDLLIAVSLHNQIQYFPLAFRQVEQRLRCGPGSLD